MKKHYLSWTDVERLVNTLIDRIGDIDRFDSLLVVTRGGMVPACLVSEWTGIRNILVAAVMFYTGVGETMAEPIFLQFPPDPFLKDQKILVVDDVWDSGRTAVAVRDRIIRAGGQPEVAVLHYKPAQSLYPDLKPEYFAEETDAWIVYPWDPREDR